MVLVLVGLLTVAPIGVTVFRGYVLQQRQHVPDLFSFCAELLYTFVTVYLATRGVVSLIAIWPKRSAQLGLDRVQRYVAARWPTFGRVTGLVPIPGHD